MRLRGAFCPPGDKSISHRIVLLSILARGECRIENCARALDVSASLQAIASLSGQVPAVAEPAILLSGLGGRVKPSCHISCHNSGTTIRLLMGILAGLPGEFVLDGDDSLRRRPMERVALPLGQMGAQVGSDRGMPPVTVSGRPLHGIRFSLPVPSAQLKSAVLLAGVQASGPTEIMEPEACRDHTERMLALCGARIRRTPGRWWVERSTLQLPPRYRVPSDISSAAFFLCAAAVLPGSDVVAEGVLLNPQRTGFLDVISRMGADVEVERQGDEPEPWGRVRVRHSPDLHGCEVGAGEIPRLLDEIPILTLMASQAAGTTVFRRVGELRVKESNRLQALTSQLAAMGARVIEKGDDLRVEGRSALTCPASLESYGDHRMAMTLRLAGLLADGEPRIREEECVAVSYPDFHETLGELGR